MSKEIQSVILAGGHGTRMEHFTKDKQKCMLEYEGKPILQHLLDNISDAFGSAEIIMALGYRWEDVVTFFGDKYRNLDIKYVYDSRPLETKKRLLLAKDVVVEPFLFLAGDIIAPGSQMQKVMERLKREKDLMGVLSVASDHEPALTHALVSVVNDCVLNIQHPPSISWTDNQKREMHVSAYDVSFLQTAETSNQALLSRVIGDVVASNTDSRFGAAIYDGHWVHISEPKDLNVPSLEVKLPIHNQSSIMHLKP